MVLLKLMLKTMVYSLTVYDKTGKPTKEVQKTFSVTKEASLGGNKFYLVKDYNSPTLIDWVKQGDVIYNNAKSPVKCNANIYMV